MRVKKCLYCSGTGLNPVSHRSDQKTILECSSCHLLMVDSVDQSPAKLYGGDYFQKPTETGSGYVDYLSSPTANLIGKYGFARLFGSASGKHLDLGCADGSLVELFQAKGFVSRGLDISPVAVGIAQEKGLEVTQSDLSKIPTSYKDNDYVTAFDILEHSDRPGDVLQQAKQSLATNGYLVFSTLSIKSLVPTEYWFNHSLEHYTYYTKESLTRILTDVFGSGNFAFFEQDVNGVAEFWGIAKKVKLSAADLANVRKLESGKDSKDLEKNFYTSLFYNQVARFDESRSIIEKNKTKWKESDYLQANFFNYFFQGQYELAVSTTKELAYKVPVSEAAFWQAMFIAEEKFSTAHKQTILEEASEEILDLRSQLFGIRDELHSMRNSRVLGKIIKTREKIGNPYTIPGRSVNKVRRTVAKFIPDSIRLPLMKNLRKGRDIAKSGIKQYRYNQAVITEVSNSTWGDKPLVSVVIPYFNRADTIDETLASLSTQTFSNFEIIIVNDGSTDKESAEKFKAIEKSGFKATFVTQVNQGVAATRNNGIKIAKGKYIICLDSDDVLEPTYIEKAATVLELNPDISIVTTYMTMFGVKSEEFIHNDYDPLVVYKNNMIITAAMFRKDAWQSVGGYKSEIGYEDWEFWMNLTHNGFWAYQIKESLFRYRTSMQSRYVEDKDVHWSNLKKLHALHPNYRSDVKKHLATSRMARKVVKAENALINIGPQDIAIAPAKANILITIPWMTFGGAETLIYNFCREVKSDYNITYVTGIPSQNEWEYKFKEISQSIYHLPNIVNNEALYLDYISRLITQNDIDTLHIIHNGFTFEMLEELKKRHPRLRVILTLFNDRAAYFDQSIPFESFIDIFTSDNAFVINHYKEVLKQEHDLRVIPNGVNSVGEFNPKKHDRSAVREELGLKDDETAAFFVGRLSEEKNPDVFVSVAEAIIKGKKTEKNIKFFVIGDGGMKKQIEEQIASINSERIQYLGYQSAIAHYLSAADIFILPSSIEGFPLSILEAMAMEVVTIASRVGGVPDIIENDVDGYIVTPGSVDEIADSIRALDKNPTHFADMKKASRKKVDTLYSNVVLGKNYKKLYGER